MSEKIDAYGIENSHLNSAIYAGKEIFVLATPRWDFMNNLDDPVQSNGPEELVQRVKEADGKSGKERYDLLEDFHKFALEKNRFAKAVNFFGHLEALLRPNSTYQSYENQFNDGISDMRQLNFGFSFDKLVTDSNVMKSLKQFLESNGIDDSESFIKNHIKNLKLKNDFYFKNNFNYETEAVMVSRNNEGVWIENAGTNLIFRFRDGEVKELSDEIRQKSIDRRKSVYSIIPETVLDYLNRGILGFHEKPNIAWSQEEFRKGDVYVLGSHFLKPKMVRSVYGWPQGHIGVNEEDVVCAVSKGKNAKDIAEKISEMELNSYLMNMGKEHDEGKANWHKYRKPLVVVKFD